jgi:hypothetical protein
MNDFHLIPTASPRPAKPARRQSSLSQLALAVLAVCGQMTKAELVAAMVARRKEAGRPAHSPNIYARLRALVAAGQIEAKRQDSATWLSGKAKFTAKAEGCPAYSGPAVLTFIKP